jgi:hypothetical protein
MPARDAQRGAGDPGDPRQLPGRRAYNPPAGARAALADAPVARFRGRPSGLPTEGQRDLGAAKARPPHARSSPAAFPVKGTRQHCGPAERSPQLGALTSSLQRRRDDAAAPPARRAPPPPRPQRRGSARGAAPRAAPPRRAASGKARRSRRGPPGRPVSPETPLWTPPRGTAPAAARRRAPSRTPRPARRRRRSLAQSPPRCSTRPGRATPRATRRAASARARGRRRAATP